MDNLDNNPAPQPDNFELIEQFESLRHLVVSILVLVIVVSGTFNIFLLRELRTAQKDLTAIRPQANAIMAQYNKSGPQINDFVKRLVEYGRTHPDPDFARIADKYGLKPTNTAALTPPRSAPPAKKK